MPPFPLLEVVSRDFPGGPVVKNPPSSAGGKGLVSGGGTKISHALWPKKPKHKAETILQYTQ